MKKLIIGVIIVAALAVGVTGGILAGKAVTSRLAEQQSSSSLAQPGGGNEWNPVPGYRNGIPMMPGNGRYGRQGPWQGQAQPQSGASSLEDAVTKAKAFAAEISPDAVVTRVYQFSNGYYALAMEKTGSKAAFGIILQSDTGNDANASGQFQKWNTKYTQMGVIADAEALNKVSMADAAKAAQQALDKGSTKATVDAAGVDFYGYYLFTYNVDGKMAGLISVNGTTSDVWNYDFLGTYVSQQEVK